MSPARNKETPMARPRERRPRPQPLTPEEAAEIEAKYEELYAFVQRLAERRPCADSPPPRSAWSPSPRCGED